MTDDEAQKIAAYLKPKEHTFLKWAGAVLAAAGVAWGVAKWAATTPTREEFNQQRDEWVRVRIELPTMNAKIERVEQSQQRQEKAGERIEAKLDELARKRRPRSE